MAFFGGKLSRQVSHPRGSSARRADMLHHFHLSDRSVRKTFVAIAIGAVVGATAVGVGSAPMASAAPPPAGCGHYSDAVAGNPPNTRIKLWERVKDAKKSATPDTRGNIRVVQPEKQNPKLYSIRSGGDHPGFGDDFLLVPTNRIQGIECSYLWDGSQLNFWRYAWKEGTTTVYKNPNKPLAIGVNSADARGQDQLHLHMAQANPATVTALKAIKKPETNLNRWAAPTSNVVLPVNDYKNKKRTDAVFRVVKYTGQMPNLVKVLHTQVQSDIPHQCIAVIASGAPNTYYLLNSTPALKSGNDRGTGLCDYVYGWN